MKKFLLSLLPFFLILNSFAVLAAFADDEQEIIESQDGSYSYSLNDTGITIVSCHEEDISGSFEVPSVIDGHTVTEIGSRVFSQYNFTDVIIPETITKISSMPFSVCMYLHKVTIPSSVTQIDGNPFYSCPDLEQIVVASDSETFATIQGVLFNKLEKSLICYPPTKEDKAYIIPSGITTIGEYAFDNSQLSRIILPDTVTSIGMCAFYRSSSLQSVNFPSSVTEIGNGNPFAECNRFTDLQFEGNDSIIYKDNLLIDNLHNRVIACITPSFVEELNVPDGIVDIAPYAFNISTVWTIVLPSSIKSLSNGSFLGCSARNIILPDTLEQIGSLSFNFCDNLENLIIPKSVSDFGFYALQGNKNLTLLVYPGSPAEDYAKEMKLTYELIQ